MSGVELKLTCLVWPNYEPNQQIVQVKIDNSDNVLALKNLIKGVYPERLHDIDVSRLVLWKCSIPIDNLLAENMNAIRFDGTDPSVNRLVPLDSPLSELFLTELPRRGVHIIAEVPPLGSGTHVEHAEAIDAISELAENIRFLEIVKHFGKPPSTAAKSTEYVMIQRVQEYAIHDGLHPKSMTNPQSNFKPLTTVAPPIHIFHPIFERFITLGNNPDLDLPREFLMQVQDFMSFASQLKTSEKASNPELLQWLTKLLGVSVLGVSNADSTQPDGMSMLEIENLGEIIPLLVVELKRILGEGGRDPSIQAGCSMRRTWIQADRAQMRNRCCCPTFIVAGGGPWICILGAVFTDKVIVQRLTDMIWIGLSSTNEDSRIRHFARVLMALRQTLPELGDYYKKISTADIPPFNGSSPHPRFYPYPTSFVENDKPIYFDYMKMLEDDPTCVTYLARIRKDVKPPDIDELIVVKFVDRYGDKVHQFLADKGCSPKLRYYGPLDVGISRGNKLSPALPTVELPSYLSSPMKMVVMDYVKPYHRPADAHAQLEKILMDLHAEGYVFGDLREPNVLFNEVGKVQLIDFNWAGRYDMKLKDNSPPPGLEQRMRNNIERIQDPVTTEFVKYPLNLSPNLSWAPGAEALLPILPQHDLEMLRRLKWN